MKRFILLLSLAASSLFAQEFRGTISGTVTDAQGAAIPKVKVVAMETRTGVNTTAFSETSGQYTIPFLALGDYEINAEVPGFKKFTRAGIKISAGDHRVIDIHLEVGAITESVTVTADAPLLMTANPSVGQVISTAQVEDVPVNGRTPMMLDNLALGVVSTFEPGPVRPFDNSAPNSVSIGGALTGRNEVLLNGAPNAGFSNQMAYSPMSGAVTEVRVNAFEMDAAIGHTMGGSVNLITKSGTNSVHGEASIFNQTSRFDANTFFNNAKNVPRPAYHQNQYGVTAGGPVYVPKVFNGKNRVFWFFGYEGMRDSDPANSPVETGSPENFTSVPTAAERQGDFSALLSVPGSNNYAIYDPQTGVLNGKLVTREMFPNNQIPQSRLSPVSQKYLQYFPMPNTAGLANGSQNFVINAIDSDNYDNELGHLDLVVSDRNKLSFDGRHNNRRQNKNNFFNNPATGNFLYRINQGGGFDDIHTLTPNTVLDFRSNWTRYQEHHFSPADSVSPNDLGFPSYLAGNAKFQTMPYIVFTSTNVSGGARNAFEPLGYNGDGTNYSDAIQLFGDVIHTHGNHTLKAGVDGREYRWSAFTFGNPSGTFTFCCQTTSGSTSTSTFMNNPSVSTTSSPWGQDMAAFLLGLPTSGSIDLNSQSTERARYLALFLQDDWRVRSNLTLNFGVRWEHDYPGEERYGRTVNGFDPTAVNSTSTAAAAAYAANPNPLLPASQFHALGGLTFASPSDAQMYHPQSYIVSPRFGFAWTPAKLGNKTSIRGGFGVFVDPIAIPSLANLQEGYSQQTTMPTTANFLLPAVATLSDPFPSGFLQPTGSSKGINTFLGQAIQFYNPNPRNPYSLRWDLSIQRELLGQMLLEVAYIANHGVHLPINTQLNPVERQFLATSLVRDNTIVNNLTGTVPNPFQGLIPSVSGMNGATIALQQLLTPFPQFPSGGITVQQANAGSSYFESLNVRLEKRMSHGLVLINNFIWASLISRISYLNDTDPVPYKTIDSSSSRPLREVFVATYDLPVGRGRRLNLQSRWKDALVGGWRVSGVITEQSGPPLNWGNYIYFGGPLNYQASNPNGLALDTTRFDTISSHQLANNIRWFANQYANLRRDYSNEVDLSLDKNFRFVEGKYLQLRFEAFNLPNHVTFGNIQTNPTNSAFGTIGSQANTPRRIETALRLVW